MALQPFSSLVKNNINRNGMVQGVATALALERCRNVMDALLDEDTSRAIRPAYIRYKALTLACRNSSAAACVGPFEQEILEYVNKGLARPMAERVRVILDSQNG